MDALRRSTLELWQYFEKLSFNTLLYRGQAITHPSVGFLPIPEDPVRRRGSLHFWHYALDHFLSKNTGLVAKQRDWQHTNTYPISMIRFLRFLSSPSSLCRRLPSTSTAVWMPLFSSANISAGSFFSLDAVMSPPASTTSTSTAVWVPLWFKYDVFFSISYYFPLFRFAGMPLRFLSFSFTWGLPSSK